MVAVSTVAALEIPGVKRKQRVKSKGKIVLTHRHIGPHRLT